MSKPKFWIWTEIGIFCTDTTHWIIPSNSQRHRLWVNSSFEQHSINGLDWHVEWQCSKKFHSWLFVSVRLNSKHSNKRGKRFIFHSIAVVYVDTTLLCGFSNVSSIYPWCSCFEHFSTFSLSVGRSLNMLTCSHAHNTEAKRKAYT